MRMTSYCAWRTSSGRGERRDSLIAFALDFFAMLTLMVSSGGSIFLEFVTGRGLRQFVGTEMTFS